MALITSETAKEFAAKSAAKRREIPAIFKKAEASIPAYADDEAREADEFRRLRLARVRAQLTKLDAMLAAEKDPSKIDRIASAAIRLNEQERQLSNRSLPPTLKASQVKSKRQTGSAPEPESA